MGTIKDWIKRGGKLPGQKGFDVKAVEEDVAKRKAEAQPVTTQEAAPTASQNIVQQAQQQPQLLDILGRPIPIAPVALPPESFGEGIKLDPNRPRGMQNVADTFRAVFGPERIQANTNNLILNYGLEAASNNPLTTALVVAGGVVGLSQAFGKTAAATGFSNVYPGANVALKGHAINSATTRLTGKMLGKVGFTMAAAAFIASSVGTYPFAKFEIVEGLDKIGYARTRAMGEGRFDLVDALNQLQDEILNPEGWDAILQKIPFANVYNSVTQNIKAAEASRQVFDKLIEDEKTKIETGQTDAELRKKNKEEEDNMFRETTKFRLELEAEYAENEREARENQRNDDAKFWANERAKQRKKEAEDREAIAIFWNEYRKKKQQIAEDNRPSNLNFGLV